MKNKILLIVTIATLAFAACHKEDRPAPSPIPVPVKKFRLARIERDSYQISVLGYNGQGQLATIVRTNYGMSQASRVIHDSEGKVVETGTADYRMLYYYTGSKLVRLAFINIHADPANTIPESFATVIWTGNNITEIVSYYIPDSAEVVFHKSTFEYYPNGNLSQFASWNFIPGENRFVRELAESYTYDDKQSPWPAGYQMLYSPFNELGDFLPSAHNMKTQTSYGESDQPYAIRRLEYSYNADGYPKTAISTWDFMDPRDATIVDTLHYSYSPIQ